MRKRIPQNPQQNLQGKYTTRRFQSGTLDSNSKEKLRTAVYRIPSYRPNESLPKTFASYNKWYSPFQIRVTFTQARCECKQRDGTDAQFVMRP